MEVLGGCLDFIGGGHGVVLEEFVCHGLGFLGELH